MTQTHYTTPAVNNPTHRTFSHLKTEERYVIQRMRKEGETLDSIARALGKHKSTISRELRRGSVEQKTTRGTLIIRYSGYTGQLVYERHRKRCKPTGKRQVADSFITAVTELIKEKKLAPEPACTICLKQGYEQAVCPKTIYNYIDKHLVDLDNLDLPLRIRRKEKHIPSQTPIIFNFPNERSITVRSQAANDREEIGHFEIDLVVGKRAKGKVILTLDERVTRIRFMVLLPDKSAASIRAGLRKILKRMPLSMLSTMKSITVDNGREFAALAGMLPGLTIYRAHPYSSWERGTNERQNGLVRRFLPKGTPFDQLTEKQVMSIESWINDFPRKMFGGRSSNEYWKDLVEGMDSCMDSVSMAEKNSKH